MSAPFNRRAALGALVALPAFGLPVASSMLVETTDTLARLIAAHAEANTASDAAAVDRFAAEPGEERVMGLAGCEYSLCNGEDRISEWVDAHHKRLSDAARTIGQLSPAVGVEALAVLDRELQAVHDRLAAAFSEHDAAYMKWHLANNAERAALFDVCRYRCTSPRELERKIAYLATLTPGALGKDQHAAIFESLAQERASL